MYYNSNAGIISAAKGTLHCLPRATTTGNLTRLRLPCIHESIHVISSLSPPPSCLSLFLLSCIYLPAWYDQCSVVNPSHRVTKDSTPLFVYLSIHSTHAVLVQYSPHFRNSVQHIFSRILEAIGKESELWYIGYNLEIGFNLGNICTNWCNFLQKVV